MIVQQNKDKVSIKVRNRVRVKIGPWQNNCLVPVTYGPESRVGRSGKYFILDKNFMSPIINLPGKMTSAKFGSLTSHTPPPPPPRWQHAVSSLS